MFKAVRFTRILFMNKYTVALCYAAQVNESLLEQVRCKTSTFGLCAEYLLDVLCEKDLMNRSLIRLGRGYDLIVVICDGSPRLIEYSVFKHFNHNLADPWATCVLAISSVQWKADGLTVAVEAERYMGHFHADKLPEKIMELLCNHRSVLHDRGLSSEEWRSIYTYASPEEIRVIKALRHKNC